MGFPPSLSAPSSIHPPLPPAHLHTFINTARRRGERMHRMHYWLATPAVCAAAARAFPAKPYLQALYIVLKRWCMMHMCICMKCVCECVVRVNRFVSACTSVCMCAGQDRASHPHPPTPPVLGLPSSPLVPPPIPTTPHTHLPHFACVIPASWPRWLIPLH